MLNQNQSQTVGEIYPVWRALLPLRNQQHMSRDIFTEPFLSCSRFFFLNNYYYFIFFIPTRRSNFSAVHRLLIRQRGPTLFLAPGTDFPFNSLLLQPSTSSVVITPLFRPVIMIQFSLNTMIKATLPSVRN